MILVQCFAKEVNDEELGQVTMICVEEKDEAETMANFSPLTIEEALQSEYPEVVELAQSL